MSRDLTGEKEPSTGRPGGGTDSDVGRDVAQSRNRKAEEAEAQRTRMGGVA